MVKLLFRQCSLVQQIVMKDQQLTGFTPERTPTYPAKLTVLYKVFPFV